MKNSDEISLNDITVESSIIGTNDNSHQVTWSNKRRHIVFNDSEDEDADENKKKKVEELVINCIWCNNTILLTESQVIFSDKEDSFALGFCTTCYKLNELSITNTINEVTTEETKFPIKMDKNFIEILFPNPY